MGTRVLCLVCGASDSEVKKMHHFPTNLKRSQIWQESLGIKFTGETLRNYKVCSKHFEDYYYTSGRMSRYAVPTLLPAVPICRVPNIGQFVDISTGDGEVDVSENIVCQDDITDSDIPITIDHSYSQLDEPNNTVQVDELINLPGNEAVVEIQEISEEEVLPRITSPVGTPERDIEELLPFLKTIKMLNPETDESVEMCRICFQAVKETEGLIFCSDDDAESETNLIRQTVLSHFPTLDFQIVGKSVICKKCIEILESYDKLKETFLITEKKVNLMLFEEMKNPKNKNRVLTIIEDAINVEIDENVETGEPSISTALTHSRGSLKYYVHRDVGTILCEICGMKFMSKKKLYYHRRKHRRDKLREEGLKKQKTEVETSRVCETCGVQVKSAKHLYMHRQIHSPINCPLCKKIFYRKSSLYGHLKHKHERKFTTYQCDVCGKQFEKSNLLYHMKTHGPKNIFCDICNKAFWTDQALRRHKVIHANNMFACHLCDKVLKYKESLEKHVQLIHFKDANIMCKICFKPFWKKYDLKKHVIRCHGKENN